MLQQATAASRQIEWDMKCCLTLTDGRPEANDKRLDIVAAQPKIVMNDVLTENIVACKSSV
jgi:hypothetical protein